MQLLTESDAGYEDAVYQGTRTSCQVRTWKKKPTVAAGISETTFLQEENRAMEISASGRVLASYAGQRLLHGDSCEGNCITLPHQLRTFSERVET